MTEITVSTIQQIMDKFELLQIEIDTVDIFITSKKIWEIIKKDFVLNERKSFTSFPFPLDGIPIEVYDTREEIVSRIGELKAKGLKVGLIKF